MLRIAGVSLQGGIVLVIVGAHKGYALEFANLPQDKGDHIRTLPVAGMEKMRQSVSGKVAQSLRAIKSVVQALGAPPFVLNCGWEI